MTKEKIVLLKIVGSLENMHDIIRELILCRIDNINIEKDSMYYSNLMIHKFESEVVGMQTKFPSHDNIYNRCVKYLSIVEELSRDLNVNLNADAEFTFENGYDFENACLDLEKIKELLSSRISEIDSTKKQLEKITELGAKIESITDKSIKFSELADLNYFDYEIGTFTNDNKLKAKRSYGSLSAIMLKIGIVKSSGEEIYMIIYPKQFKDETDRMLKSLNWAEMIIPDQYCGSVADMIKQINAEIIHMQNKVKELSESFKSEKYDIKNQIVRIYDVFRLENKITESALRADIISNSFALSIRLNEIYKEAVEQAVRSVTEHYLINEKSADESDAHSSRFVKLLKNNLFSKPLGLI